MIRPVGQPTKSSFETIKTLYWFRVVKSLITKELINKCQKEIQDIGLTKGNAERFDKSKLRTLNNKLDRLSGKGSYKKYGPKFSEISDHLHEVGVFQDSCRLNC